MSAERPLGAVGLAGEHVEENEIWRCGSAGHGSEEIAVHERPTQAGVPGRLPASGVEDAADGRVAQVGEFAVVEEGEAQWVEVVFETDEVHGPGEPGGGLGFVARLRPMPLAAAPGPHQMTSGSPLAPAGFSSAEIRRRAVGPTARCRADAPPAASAAMRECMISPEDILPDAGETLRRAVRLRSCGEGPSSSVSPASCFLNRMVRDRRLMREGAFFPVGRAAESSGICRKSRMILW